MSNRVWAEMVVAPGCSTWAETLSTIWRSRSVAISLIAPSADASISTLDRIGIVLRRSTTDWTWLRLLSSVARSMVAFMRSEEHTSELQSLMRISYAVFCLTKKKTVSQLHQV